MEIISKILKIKVMKKMEIEIDTLNYGLQKVELFHARRLFAGYGRFKIEVDIMFQNKSKIFTATTNNTHDTDNAMDIEDLEAQQFALYELIENKIIDEIKDFINDVLTQLEFE